MNYINTADHKSEAGNLTRVKETTHDLAATADVMKADSQSIVREVQHLNSEPAKKSLDTILKDAAALADRLRNPHKY